MATNMYLVCLQCFISVIPSFSSVTIHTFDVYREEIYEDVCKKVSETAREADQSMARKLAHKYNHAGKVDNITIQVR